MKILIDINHPAHVHYFRNFIRMMESKGHTFKVINRDSPLINYLLDYYRIEHSIRNRRPKRKGSLASLVNLGKMVGYCIKESRAFKPDLYLGFASSACAITSALFGKPCILIDDTEHNRINHTIYLTFCTCVLTPFYFKKDLGKKQIYFNAFVEQLYLHSRYFKANEEVLEELKLKPYEYVLVRYIAYDAHHDLGTRPLSEEKRKEIVSGLSEKYSVLLSMENSPSDDFYSGYLLTLSPEQIHDVEAYAKFMVSEGATMASESFILGVPYLYINPLKVGNMDYQTTHYPEWTLQGCDANKVKSGIQQLEVCDSDRIQASREIENKTIDPTAFLIWFVESYPHSYTVMKQNPNYQLNFAPLKRRNWLIFRYMRALNNDKLLCA